MILEIFKNNRHSQVFYNPPTSNEVNQNISRG